MKNNETGKLSGHAVCVFQGTDGKKYWADYRNPTEWSQPWEWAEQSANRYNATMLAAGMIEVEDVTKRDSIKWGKWTSNFK